MRLIRCLAGLVALAAASAGWSAEPVPAALKERVERLAPGTPADAIAPTPLPGVYEVTFGPTVVYISADGRFLLQGDVIDLETRSNLTENKRRLARVDAVASLPTSGMIVFSPEKVSHSVTVFTDVDCPYCAKLHAEIPDYNALGIEVRYAAFPRAGIPSRSYDKTVSVWCADDPKFAIGEAKFGRPIPEKSCENPVSDHYRMGHTIGVTGTPAIVLENGEIIPGYVPPERLARMFKEGS